MAAESWEKIKSRHTTEQIGDVLFAVCARGVVVDDDDDDDDGDVDDDDVDDGGDDDDDVGVGVGVRLVGDLPL
eukprot:1245195-Rhodomonas_salina.1